MSDPIAQRYGLFLERDHTYAQEDAEEVTIAYSDLVAIAQDPDALKSICAPRNVDSCALFYEGNYLLGGYIVDFATGCKIMGWGLAEGGASAVWTTLEIPQPKVRIC